VSAFLDLWDWTCLSKVVVACVYAVADLQEWAIGVEIINL
jgi:hypothetical protein